MKVKCTSDIDFFTNGKIYEVYKIDNDGDIWVKQDDTGHQFFMHPRECEFVIAHDDCPTCKGSGKV